MRAEPTRPLTAAARAIFAEADAKAVAHGQRARVRFLAQSAAQIAAGYAANPETSGQDCRRIARDSFAIAQAILECADEWLVEHGEPPRPAPPAGGGG